MAISKWTEKPLWFGGRTVLRSIVICPDHFLNVVKKPLSFALQLSLLSMLASLSMEFSTYGDELAFSFFMLNSGVFADGYCE